MMLHHEACLAGSNGETVHLQEVNIVGDLTGALFAAHVEQHFSNTGKKNLEVIYSFPLPWGAVLLGVDVLLGDKRLTGAVVEKRTAEARYEAALTEGDAAIMLERNHDASYSLNLGNLAPDEHCVITLRYAQLVQFADDGLRLLIPTVIAPRYGDPIQDAGLMPHQTVEHNLVAEYPLQLEIRLHGELARAAVASPSHPIRVTPCPDPVAPLLKITLARQAFLDRDFILLVAAADGKRLADGIVSVARDTHEASLYVILASFCPRLQSATRAAHVNVKILVDCSGSMAGDSIAAARRALQAVVAQLGAEDQFSLSRFGSTVEHRLRSLWKTNERTQSAAQQWVATLDADLGGTEMENALRSTFALSGAEAGDANNVLLLTDGDIHAIDQTIEAARASGHRLFVVGVGSASAESHLRRLAEATGGACDFVAPGEAVEPAVLRMFARLRSPRFAAVKLLWPAGMQPTWVAPLPPVFEGDSVHVFALTATPPAGEIRLMGEQEKEPALLEIGCARLADSGMTADPQNATLARMAAATRYPLASETEAAALAVDYQLVTERTNFLLIHERAAHEKAIDMPRLAKVRQMLPAGYGGVGGAVDYAYAPPSGLVRNRRQRQDDTLSVVEHVKRRFRVDVTPIKFIAWLQNKPENKWPKTFAALWQSGLPTACIVWLFDIDAPESEVVQAFLYLLRDARIRAALKERRQQEALALAFEAICQTLREKSDETLPDVRLVEIMTFDLRDMTRDNWPPEIARKGALINRHDLPDFLREQEVQR
jgi:Ca-activated chloride channel family protein